MPSTVFSGSKVKALKSTLSLNGGADIISTTSNPQTSAVDAAPGSLLLNTTTGTMYRKLDSGSTTNWVEVGAGTGGKNYLANPDFDNGLTTGWNIKKVTLSSLIPTGNIGAADANHTISVSSSNPLEGKNSLLVQGTSAFNAGNCLVSDAFTIDREDQAKVMGWSFSYEAVTANMDFPGTSSNTWAVYIAEVSAATGAGADTVTNWIQPAGVYNLVQRSGVGLASGTFQTTASGQYYRLVLVCINGEAAATTLKVDDFQLGPQKVVYGAPVTDWQAYTPSVGGLGTGSGTALGYWKRVGDGIQVRIRFTKDGSAGSGATNVSFSIPSGLVIDTSKLPLNPWAVVGTATYYATTYTESTVITENNTSVALSVPGTGNAYRGTQIAASSNIGMMFFVPITGWSSNVAMSSDTDTRVVAARANNPATTAFTGTPTNPGFQTVSFDTHGTLLNGVYTVPVSGYYKVSTCVRLANNQSLTAGKTIGSNIYKQGAYDSTIGGLFAAATVSPPNGPTYFASGIVYANAGQTLEVRNSNDQGTLNLLGAGDPSLNWVSFERLSGPATIAASESVACRYQNTAGTSIALGGTGTVVPFSSAYYDTHGFFNGSTGVATIPVSGKYQIQASIYFAAASWTNSSKWIEVRQGASRLAFISLYNTASFSGALGMNGTAVLDLKAGDQISFTVVHNESAARNLDTVAHSNQISIVRVGN